MRLYQNPSKVKTCLNKAIKKILSDSFYIYLAWILGKVSATKSIIFFLALDQFWFSLYQKWGRPLYHFWYRLNQNWYRVDRFWSALYQFWKYTYCLKYFQAQDFRPKSCLKICLKSDLKHTKYTKYFWRVDNCHQDKFCMDNYQCDICLNFVSKIFVPKSRAEINFHA